MIIDAEKLSALRMDEPPFTSINSRPSASKKHLFRYVDEFTWRLNEGNVANHTTRRLDSFVDATVGKRLTYKRLIA